MRNTDNAVFLLLDVAAGFSSYMMRNINILPEFLKLCSNEILCVLILLWVYSFIDSETGCIAEVYYRKKVKNKLLRNEVCEKI